MVYNYYSPSVITGNFRLFSVNLGNCCLLQAVFYFNTSKNLIFVAMRGIEPILTTSLFSLILSTR